MIDFAEMSRMVETGKVKVIKELVKTALEEGASASDILNKGLLPGMNAVGEKFKNNEVYIPEVLISARALNTGVNLLKPLLAAGDVEKPGTAVIGTVHGDLHDIGKNLVKMMLESKGIEVIDLGVDEFYAEEDGITVYAAYENFGGIQKWLDDNNYEIVSGEGVYIPTDTKELDAEGREAIEKLVERLEEDDDVTNVYHTMKEVDEE